MRGPGLSFSPVVILGIRVALALQASRSSLLCTTPRLRLCVVASLALPRMPSFTCNSYLYKIVDSVGEPQLTHGL